MKKMMLFIDFHDYTTFVVVPATPTERYTHLFGAFALLPAALLLPDFQSLQLYADQPCCPGDRALRRHIHLIPRQ
jgi:hypothetical protein